MSDLIVIWNAPQPKTYQRVLFRFNRGVNFRYWQNWKANTHGLRHWNLITPFIRFTKCNGQIEIGLGNHYLELGW